MAIAKFSKSASKFVSEHGFDGLSVEWQYPVCWQSDCGKGKASDRWVGNMGPKKKANYVVNIVSIPLFISVIDKASKTTPFSFELVI
jgi:GH18 family chitinase